MEVCVACGLEKGCVCVLFPKGTRWPDRDRCGSHPFLKGQEWPKMTALARGGMPPTGTSHQFLKKKKKRKGKGQDKTKEKRQRHGIKQKKIPGSGGGNGVVNDPVCGEVVCSRR